MKSRTVINRGLSAVVTAVLMAVGFLLLFVFALSSKAAAADIPCLSGETGLKYEDGVYYYIADDFSKFAGYRTIDGVLYFFDPSNGCKGGPANGVHAKDFITYKYYVEGIPQTDGLIETADGTRYFASADGTLLSGIQTDSISGNSYYFYGTDAAENRYKLAESKIIAYVTKDGKTDTVLFNADADGELDKLFTAYPCHEITVYDKTGAAQVAVNPNGSYTLVGAHTYEIKYNAVSHVFDSVPVYAVEATCSSDGYYIYACTVYGCTETKRVDITERPAHVFTSAITEIRAPSCTESGIGMIWCTNGCGAYDTLEIAPVGHTFSVWTTVASTCSEAGYRNARCDRFDICGMYVHEALPLASHAYGPYTETVKATCVSGGVKSAVCANCSATNILSTSSDHDNHANGNADGTLYRYDEDCAVNFELFKVTKAPTESEDGTALFKCKDCGGLVYNVAIELGVRCAECTYETRHDLSNHWQECKHCGAKLNEAAHDITAGFDDDYHWTVDCACGYNDKKSHVFIDVDGVPPTSYMTGYTDHKACACGATQGYETVEFRPNNFTDEYKNDENENRPYYDDSDSTVYNKARSVRIGMYIYIFDADGRLVVMQSNYICSGIHFIIGAQGTAGNEDEE